MRNPQIALLTKKLLVRSLGMSSLLLYSTKPAKLLVWLIHELTRQIPDFDPRGQDYVLLSFAYKDLNTMLDITSRPFEDSQKELKIFLKLWTSQWLTKWRERVSLFQKNPKLPGRCQRCINQAEQIYRKMPYRADLKRLVIYQLFKRGELCMPESIADTLITKEIIQHLNKHRTSRAAQINVAKLYNNISFQINRLKHEKKPLFYLKIQPTRTAYPNH